MRIRLDLDTLPQNTQPKPSTISKIFKMQIVLHLIQQKTFPKPKPKKKKKKTQTIVVNPQKHRRMNIRKARRLRRNPNHGEGLRGSENQEG